MKRAYYTGQTLLCLCNGLLYTISTYTLFSVLLNDGFSHRDSARFVALTPLLLIACNLLFIPVSYKIQLRYKKYGHTRIILFLPLLLAGSFVCYVGVDRVLFYILEDYSVTFQAAFNDFNIMNNRPPSLENLPIGYQCLYINLAAQILSFLLLYPILFIFERSQKR